MKKLLALIVLAGAFAPTHAQSLLQYHGPRDAALPMPLTGANAVTQYAVRMSAPQDHLLSRVDLWLDGIVGGAFDSTISYNGLQAAFDWPFPFTHVPQTFVKQAVRFTAPGNGRLRSVEVFIGNGTSSEDGFNDSLKISFLPQIQTQNITVKYGTESATNNPTWNFYFPVGTARTSYGTRYTAPVSPDSFRVGGVQFFVNGINDNTFLPAGNTPPNDTLRVRLWNVDAVTKLPTQMRGEVKVPLVSIANKQWNTVNLFATNVYVPGGSEIAITLDLIAVDALDHLALASAASNPSPLKRSLILESGVWKTIDVSTAYAGGGAANAELWTRALFLDPSNTALAENDPLAPNESAPLGHVTVPLSSLIKNNWNTITLPTPVEVLENQELWAAAEVIRVGGQDIVSFVSHFAETTPQFRTAVYIGNQQGGGNWRYMHNTQFGSEYIFRIRAKFGVDDQTGVNDDLILILYENGPDNLPGNFINAKFLPLSSLRAGEFNPINVSSWNYRFTDERDVHVAVSAEFETNSFALAGDNGIPSNTIRTSAFKPNAGGWAPATRNLLLNAEVIAPTSIESESDRTDRFELMQNYPNPFNPKTVIGFQLSVFGNTSLKVYDMLGREVATLVDGIMSAGAHQVTFDGSGLSSGIYLVRLTAGSESRLMRMTLLK